MKKVLSPVLVVALCLSLFALLQISVNATSQIEQRINTIKQKYPDGSYFSQNGKACAGSSSNHGCNNCALENIDAAAFRACGSGKSCWAFANYVFYHTFGVAPSDASNTVKYCAPGSLNKYAKFGDYIECYDVTSDTTGNHKIHYFIYAGGSGEVNCYRYESNVNDQPNKVAYHNVAQSKGGIKSFKIIHAYNYEQLNKGAIAAPTNVKATVDGSTIRINWDAAEGANCYDVIVTYPGGNQKWFHTSGTSKTFTGLAYGEYQFDVQSLYRNNGSTSGQIVGPHSGNVACHYTMQGAGNLRAELQGDRIFVQWDAAQGADCYDVIVTTPNGSTQWLHAIEPKKVIENIVPGVYKIHIQSLYRPNGTKQGQVVGPHSSEVIVDNSIQAPKNTDVRVDGSVIKVSWDSARAANCYDVIVTYPDGKQKWFHTNQTSKTFTGFAYGEYQFDVQSLYRQEGNPSAQVVGPHSGNVACHYTMQGADNLSAELQGDKIFVQWDAAQGADCYDVIVTTPNGSTQWLHAIEPKKVIENIVPGVYTIHIQSLYRPNGTKQGQVVGPHSSEVIVDNAWKTFHYSVPALKSVHTSLIIKSHFNEYEVAAKNGVFELEQIKGDVYKVYATGKNALTVCLGEYDTKNAQAVNEEHVVLPLGNVNGDEVIDIADISMLLAGENYGQVNAQTDLTGDNIIDVADIALALKAENFGKHSAIIVS
ncbi:MAG: hypothetical protein IJJ41_08975 [Clostridia bacterium]|nr:hypothetical protein [Clostridia bacterium]